MEGCLSFACLDHKTSVTWLDKVESIKQPVAACQTLALCCYIIEIGGIMEI